MAAKGHEELFPPLSLSDRSGLRKGTFAGTRGNDEDAPIPVVRPEPMEPTIAVIRRGYVDRPTDNLWWPVSITV
jgi:hypothetical protein